MTTSRVIGLTRFRFPISALLSALLTIWFFTALRVVIDVAPGTLDRPPIVELGLPPLRRPLEIEPRRPKKPTLVKPEPAPTRPMVDIDKSKYSGWDPGLDPLGPGIGKWLGPQGGIEPGGPGGGISQLRDSEPLPLVRVDPAYPPHAEKRGLEGWVHVRFTVTTAGSVEDVVTVESSDALFERAAVAAALKWKYQPALKEGKPIESRVETVIRFQMDRRRG